MKERIIDLLPDDGLLCFFFGIIANNFENKMFFQAVADSSMEVYNAEKDGELSPNQVESLKDYIWSCISVYKGE